MSYFNLSDSIEKLKLSARTHHALRRIGITSIQELLNYPKEDIPKIRNMGTKSVKEVYEIISNLSDSINENELMDDEEIQKVQKYYIGYDGKNYIDELIDTLKLSVRAKNCLKSVGIEYFSQLIDKFNDELIGVRNMGMKTMLEIENFRRSYHSPASIDETNDKNIQSIEGGTLLYKSISEKIRINQRSFFEIFSKEHTKYCIEHEIESDVDLAEDKRFMKQIFENEKVRFTVNEYVFQIISNKTYGCEESYLMQQLPICFQDREILDGVLNDLIISNKIDLIYDNRFVPIRENFESGIHKILNEKECEVIIHRMHGRTLEEVGKIWGMSREGIRQIEVKAIRRLNETAIVYTEDIYLDIFNRYVITKEDFMTAFNDEISYQYLQLRYGSSNTENKQEKMPLDAILEDREVPVVLRKALEKAIYSKYVKIGSSYIPCTRDGFTMYIIKTYGQEDLSFDEFNNIYFLTLKDIDKLDDSNLMLTDHGYENKIANSNIVLWKFGKRFRYYNIEAYDYTELLNTLNLSQYKDVEYSTLKFLRIYPELMKTYDIRDEYELHNLLKKICKPEEYPELNFKRMPNIEFGDSDRENQVFELLIALAPISNADFAREYEAEYGVVANTVIANYLGNFDQYFYNGFYNFKFPTLPNEISSRLRELLTEDFYLLSTIRDIYQSEFPQADNKLLTSYSLKKLGFKLYSSYAVRDKYSSVTDYFNSFLTKDDVVNVEEIPSKAKELMSYSEPLNKLKLEYKIIEFMPNKYIQYRKLQEFGVTKEMFKSYCDDVQDYVGEGKYFTIFSLRKYGFTHELDDLGFDEWFYTSILIENKSKLSYQRIGGNKIMLYGRENIKMENLLEYLVYSQDDLSIDVYELNEKLRSEYNVNVNIHEVINVVKHSFLYYDAISERVFEDYDTYFEVV